MVKAKKKVAKKKWSPPKVKAKTKAKVVKKVTKPKTKPVAPDFTGKTMMCLILDRSGSMGGKESDVIGGVNKFIDEQKKLPNPASLAFVRFDTQAIERFVPMTPLSQVTHLKAEDYQPRGGTPLLDAVGETLQALDGDWKQEKPERAIVVIATDGYENSSHAYTKAKIREMIEARQNSGLWTFIFLGAGIDAFAEATQLGINLANVASTTPTSAGTKHAYDTVSQSVRYLRSSGATFTANLGKTLGEQDDEDVKMAGTEPPKSTTKTTTAKGSTWTPPTGTVGGGGSWNPPA